MSKQKKKQKKIVNVGIASVKTTFNNTLITISDILGNTLCWSSAGSSGFKGAKKSTPFAAQTAARTVALKAVELGMEKIEGLTVLSIEDKTSIPHNGCRPPKKRRL